MECGWLDWSDPLVGFDLSFGFLLTLFSQPLFVLHFVTVHLEQLLYDRLWLTGYIISLTHSKTWNDLEMESGWHGAYIHSLTLCNVL